MFIPCVAKKGRHLRLALFSVSSFALIVIVGFPVVAIILFALFPHLNELSLAQPFSTLVPTLRDERLVEATLNSLDLSISVTAASVFLAVPLAHMRTRFGVRMGRFWDACFLVPFLIPPYIGSLAWMQLLQRNGFVEQVLGFNMGGFLYSFPGIVSVMALHLFPLVYFTTSNAFAVIGTRYGDVAKVFGGRFLAVFFRIELPMALPAVLSSALIVFILTIEEFGTPEILGSRFGFQVIVTAIHEKFADWPVDLPGAATLSLLLIVIAFGAFQIHKKLSNRFQASVDNQDLDRRERTVSSLLRLVLVVVFTMLFVVSVVLPLLSIAISALMDTVSGGVRLDNMSFSHITGLFVRNSDAWRAIVTSLTLAALAALVCVSLAMVVVFTVVRLRFRGTGFLDFMSILPNAIPGMAVAVGLILVWNQRFWPVTPYNTTFILLLAYLSLMLPYPVRMISAGLRQLPRSLDDAAYISGAGEIVVIWKILAPLLAPIALSSGLIVFAISTRELVSSIMLAPPGVQTVATYVFYQFDQGSINSGMAMSLVTVVISGTIIALGQGLQGKFK